MSKNALIKAMAMVSGEMGKIASTTVEPDKARNAQRQQKEMINQIYKVAYDEREEVAPKRTPIQLDEMEVERLASEIEGVEMDDVPTPQVSPNSIPQRTAGVNPTARAIQQQTSLQVAKPSSLSVPENINININLNVGKNVMAIFKAFIKR